MNRWDLEKLELLLNAADRVVTMREIANQLIIEPTWIGMRHDVDDNKGSLDTAWEMAEWEYEHGWQASYYLLHDSHYWNEALETAVAFEAMGHEVGIHINAIAEGLRQRRNPEILLGRAIDQLREAGCSITGGVAHGDPLCRLNGEVVFVNDEMFLESARPSLGMPDRIVHDRDGWGFRLDPVSRREFGLEYDPNWLPRGDYLSDSGGTWSQPFEEVAGRFGQRQGQLHMLVHPDWWAEAFKAVPV